MIRTGKGVTQKDDLKKIRTQEGLMGGGTCVIYLNTNNEGGTYFMVAWKEKINLIKVKKQKNKLITNMIFIV